MNLFQSIENNLLRREPARRIRESPSHTEEFADDLPRSGDNRSTNLKSRQLEGKELEIYGTQMFVAR